MIRIGNSRIGTAVATCLVAGVAALTAAWAADIEHTVGDTFDIAAGDVGFGTKKPKVKAVFLPVEPGAKGDPKLKLKVIEVTDQSATVLVKKAKGVGSFDLMVKPKGGDFYSAGTVTTTGPNAQALSTDTVAAGAEMTVTGSRFGTKKGKVFVAGKKAKVIEWTDTSITFRVHKKTPAGTADVEVQNKLGDDAVSGQLTVTAPPPSIDGKERMTARTGGQAYKANNNLGFVGTYVSGRLVVGSAEITNSGRVQRRFAIQFDVDLDSVGFPFTSNLSAFGSDLFTYIDVRTGGGLPPTVDTESFALGVDDGSSASVTLTGYDSVKGVVTGTFEANLRKQEAGTNEFIGIENGDFLIKLND